MSVCVCRKKLINFCLFFPPLSAYLKLMLCLWLHEIVNLPLGIYCQIKEHCSCMAQSAEHLQIHSAVFWVFLISFGHFSGVTVQHTLGCLSSYSRFKHCCALTNWTSLRWLCQVVQYGTGTVWVIVEVQCKDVKTPCCLCNGLRFLSHWRSKERWGCPLGVLIWIGYLNAWKLQTQNTIKV